MPKIKVNKKSSKKVQKGGSIYTNKKMLEYINTIKDIYVNKIKCGNEENFNKETFDEIDTKIKTCNLSKNNNNYTLNSSSRTFKYTTVLNHINELYEKNYKESQFANKPISKFYKYLTSELATGLVDVRRNITHNLVKTNKRISGTKLAEGSINLTRKFTYTTMKPTQKKTSSFRLSNKNTSLPQKKKSSSTSNKNKAKPDAVHIPWYKKFTFGRQK